MTTIDQNIWIERIKKEEAVRQKFSLVTRQHGGVNCYAAVRHFVRDGKSPQLLKNKPFYMVDSTYTIASDPNTMRDTGPLRNAQYTVVDRTEKIRPSSAKVQIRSSSAVKTQKPLRMLDQLLVVAANDYTKNVSSPIFSPSLNERPKTQFSRNIKCSTTKGEKKPKIIDRNKYQKVESQLENERIRRARLENEVRMLRDQMSTIQMSVNSGMSSY